MKYTNSMEREPSVEATLPKISLESGGTILDTEGLEIGFVEIEENDSYLVVQNIKLDESHIGKGYGKSTYLELIKLAGRSGKTLQSGEELSRQALKVWEWLVHKGLAIKIAEGFRDETKLNTLYTDEKYESL